MNTKKFRTKTDFIPRENGFISDVWEIGMDIGYSGVKIMAPNKVACFPSYAKKVEDDFQYALNAPEDSILYKNLSTNEMWIVGKMAQKFMTVRDTDDSEASLYSRDRYYSDMFKVYSEAGLAIGLQENAFGGPKNSRIVLQTGLPERYMGDEDILKESLCGKHEFALKIGNEEWVNYNFNLDKNDIYVMSQPKGTLFSAFTNKNGQTLPEAKTILNSSVLVIDVGFGTFDVFHINSGHVDKGETFSNLGMKRVLQETSKLIKSNYDIEISVPAMQDILETGSITAYDKKTRSGAMYPIDTLLKQANNKVCEEALNTLNNCASFDFSKIKYVIITGGTGAAWFDKFEVFFNKIPWINIIRGNRNDDLDFIYSNVRGYYYYRFNKLGRS